METDGSVSSSKPSVVNIGALYTFNSVIGQSVMPAIEAAADDVNSDTTVLAGMKLNLILRDTNCSGFLGIVEGDALAKKRAKISYKAAFTPGACGNDINDLLVRVNMMESRVYVVYVNPDSVLTIFSVAKLLQMLTTDYNWIGTDWLPSVLDSSESIDLNTMNLLQGIIALRLTHQIMISKRALRLVLIINSSYTTSLTSILVVQQLLSNIEAIDSLISSTDSIGVQDGSFTYNYLIEELCWQYRKYTPEDKEQDIVELESVRPKSTLHMTSFKDFVDKKEDEIVESIKWKSYSKQQASQHSYGHPSSPSR
ncbi:Glutamate receptor 3.4 [Camellia lanceoleosa]|uniref:Glutamate receptor 3.4 n=1 Tax=Camellia lanceoleosa TaxID=1840588 RepID=A0ACC0HE27_9ERIC|nr:Glutamate receptor 3.4 [Camellia lanceoleosa]